MQIKIFFVLIKNLSFCVLLFFTHIVGVPISGDLRTVRRHVLCRTTSSEPYAL